MDAAVFDRYREAWNNHDVDALVEFFTDDGVYEDATLARVNRGKAEIRSFAQEAFANAPDFHVEDSGLIIDPSGRFGFEWTMSGTHQGDTGPHKFSVARLRASSRATRLGVTLTIGTWRSSWSRSG